MKGKVSGLCGNFDGSTGPGELVKPEENDFFSCGLIVPSYAEAKLVNSTQCRIAYEAPFCESLSRPQDDWTYSIYDRPVLDVDEQPSMTYANVLPKQEDGLVF
jgi:hypothetical protein